MRNIFFWATSESETYPDDKGTWEGKKIYKRKNMQPEFDKGHCLSYLLSVFFFFFFLSRSSIVVQDATLDTVKFYWSLICIDFLFGLSIGQTTWTVEIIFDFLLFLLARRIKKTNMDESKKENKKREKLKAVIICTDTYETRR